MVQPINYFEAMPQVDLGRSLIEGLQIGATIGEIQQRQAARQQEMLAKQQAEQRLQAFRGEVENAFQQANPEVWLQLKTKYPEYDKVVSPVWEQLDEKQRKAEISQYLPLQSALNAGNKEVAKKYVQRLIDANAAAGRDTQKFQDIASQIDDDINIARDTLINTTAMVLPLKDFAEAQKKLSETKRAEAMAPITMRKESALSAEAEQKAKQAAIKSRFAESEAVIDLEKKGWDIRKIQSDISIAKQNAQIAAANVQIGKTTNDLKRQELELKVEDMKQKRDSTVREKAAEVESARFNIDNMLNTANRILKNPRLNDVVGTIEGRLPVVLSDQAQDAVALIETLGSQAFLSQIPNVKGMGQLSNAEGEKLQNALQNLGRVQSEEQFRENLQEATRLLNKARENVSLRFGVPETAPDVPARSAAAPAAGGFSVTAPNGQTFTFPTKQAADQFKQAAGIR